MIDQNQINQAVAIINEMKVNLNKMYSNETIKVKTTLEGQLSSKVNAQLATTSATYQPQVTNAQTQANQAKFQREDILQNIQRQRQQQGLQGGNNYLEGLR